MPLLPNTLRKQMCHSVERRRGVKMESWRSEETESSLGKKWSCDGECVPAGVSPNGAFWG
jgi:hypothetical protein